MINILLIDQGENRLSTTGWADFVHQHSTGFWRSRDPMKRKKPYQPAATWNKKPIT